MPTSGRQPTSAASSQSPAAPRVTFLVNVWLNHTPKSATPLPDETAAALTSGRLDIHVSTENDGDRKSFVAPTVIKVLHRDDKTGEVEPGGGKKGDDLEGGGAGQDGVKYPPHHCSGEVPKENSVETLKCCSNGSAAATATANAAACCDGVGKQVASTGQTRQHRHQHQIEGNSKDNVAKSNSNSSVYPSGSHLATSTMVPIKEESEVVKMRWQFGEVGAESIKQVHVRHDVVVPVPLSLIPAAEVTAEGGCVGLLDGESFCVVFPAAGTRPRVSRIGGDDEMSTEGSDYVSSGESDEEDSDGADGEEDEEDE